MSFPEHGDDRGALLSAADAALYRAKRSGRARVGEPIVDRPDRSLPSVG